ncbi:MAG: hypothetical protein JWQ49_6003 [Edaphobacter sp.]|nr:hypothetical protein [Edaphobacter sp.]
MTVLPLIFAILALSPNASYSSPAGGEDPSSTGVWKGNSVCQIKDSHAEMRPLCITCQRVQSPIVSK